MPLSKPSMGSHAANQIRLGIERGDWGDQLPGGRELARVIGVSRPVIYQALRLLQAEGLLNGKTKAARVVRTPAPGHRAPSAKVVFLSAYHLEEFEETPSHLSSRLGRELAERELRLEYVRSTGIDQRAHLRSLDALARAHNPRAWVLYRCSTEVQNWFSERALPCLVLGRSPAELRLPRVDTDYAAAARHLLGRALSLGHRREDIRLLVPRERLAGHRMTAEALFGEFPAAESSVELDSEPDLMAQQIDQALDRRPTLLVTLRAIQAQAAVGRLWDRGMSCPRDISLVSLQDSTSLAAIRPEITRYSASEAGLSRALLRALGNLLDGSTPGGQGKLVLPELLVGSTLGRGRGG